MRSPLPEYTPDPASFRDPAGRVFTAQDRVLRAITDEGYSYFQTVKKSPFWSNAIREQRIVETHERSPDELPGSVAGMLPRSVAVLEHKKIPFISYPFEWPFELLQRAALLHVDLHLEALEGGLNIVDGTAYNVQFVGTKPIFIDVLSLRPYEPGEYWLGYSQFCISFLGPLLLSAYRAVPYMPTYRGNLTGIPVEAVAQLLPFRSLLNPTALLHIFLQAHLSRRHLKHSATNKVNAKNRKPLPKKSLEGVLRSLRAGISRLSAKGPKDTTWSRYDKGNSYAESEAARKFEFVARYISRTNPKLLWDVGCNTGQYSELALANGAQYVVGFDSDLGALKKAVARADGKALSFLPLYMNFLNPTPDLGWANLERKSPYKREAPDGLLALAIVHHLAIAQNVPLDYVTEWLVSLAPSGVVEFVPKNDPMVQLLLADRADIFPHYNLDTFHALMQRRARVVRQDCVSSTGRTLFEFERPD